MNLYLDTTDFEVAFIALRDDVGQEIASVSLVAGKQLTHDLVPSISALCQEQGITFKQLTNVTVHTGPGSFTGTRIGVAVGNALGYSLDIPVNGERSVVPRYGAPPNITL